MAGLTQLVPTAVDDTLALARTGITWNGAPTVSEDGDRLFTPHKAIRRTVDHLVDHLAEIESVSSGVESIPDNWHGSRVTLASALALFTKLIVMKPTSAHAPGAVVSTSVDYPRRMRVGHSAFRPYDDP